MRPSGRLPRALYRVEQVRMLDRIAVEECGIESFELMRRAGAAAFEALRARWPQARRVRVFAGAGNNGGDGWVLAGLAAARGLAVEVTPAGDPERLTGDAAAARAGCLERRVTVTPPAEPVGAPDPSSAVVVDALLGTGLDRPAEGEWAAAIDRINGGGCPVLALDVPSGLCADTGAPLGPAVRADVTVTFIGVKRGLLTGRAADHTGELLFSDLDVPAAAYSGPRSPVPAAARIDINDVAACLPPRRPSAHKGCFGRVLVVGGDRGMGGAALLAAEAALRAGAGRVGLLTRAAHLPAMLARRPEVMAAAVEDGAERELMERADVIVVGPGLGLGGWSRRLLELALEARRPLVVDADGLTLLAAGAARRDDWLLTPHPGEAAALLGMSAAEVQRDRFAAVEALAERRGGHCLLKGSGSLAAGPGGPAHLVDEGNAGMASGGMGDVLAGLAGGLLAQHLEPGAALRCAACVHGEAADLAAAEAGRRGLLAGDLLARIPPLLDPARGTAP